MGAAEKQEQWLTCAEAAERMRVKPQTVRTLVFRGKLVPDHRGGCGGLKGHRFLESTIERYLRGANKAANQ